MSNLETPTVLSKKRPDEDIPIKFDFSKLADSLDSAVVTCVRLRGTADAAASSMVSGSATIVGTLVTQKVIDGVAGTDYLFQCEATSGPYRYILAAELPVRAP